MATSSRRRGFPVTIALQWAGGLSFVNDTAGQSRFERSVFDGNMSSSVGLAREAGEALNRIDARVQETVGVVMHIAEVTREQSAASQEIARLVERIAQAAEGTNERALGNQQRAQELEHLADELQAQLSRFTT